MKPLNYVNAGTVKEKMGKKTNRVVKVEFIEEPNGKCIN